ncbi:hypothetical protein TNCV_3694721 [Trichonephila clavipes]|nr:hypothetical protein TNCV_3694721 [Trichonephila clavipes]
MQEILLPHERVQLLDRGQHPTPLCDCPTRDFFAPSLDLNIANYTTYRNGRLTQRGGGTALLVKNSIPHSFQITTSSVESTTIVIESLPTNITVCSLYNPGIFSQKPRSRPSQDLEIDHSVSLWDYNARHTSWSVNTINNSAGTTLAHFIRTSGFLLTALLEFQSAAGPQP